MFSALLLEGGAAAESLLTEDRLAPIYDFAREYAADQPVRQALQDALSGRISLQVILTSWVQNSLLESVQEVLSAAIGILAPLMLLVLLRALQPDESKGGNGAAFLLRMHLIFAFFSLCSLALGQAQGCLEAAAEFCASVAPLLTALIAALGLEGTAALVSPAASLAGSVSGSLFQQMGLPLCRIALCTAAAGNLSTVIRLDRFTNLLKKAANWSAGLITTFFTALLALQGTVSEGVDSIGVRTAKFAVDSAAPVIGSGVSDAWESYVSGVMVAKNAVGVSGIAALILSGARPVSVCLCVLLVLNLAAVLLEVFGEKDAARAAEQIGGVCRMAVSLCTAALAIAMILLGACMAAGRSLLG